MCTWFLFVESVILWVFVKLFWSLVGQCFLEVLLFITLTDLEGNVSELLLFPKASVD